MKFSDFAKMMYPLIGMGQQTCDFVIFLTNLVIETPLPENAKNTQYDIDDINPLSNYSPSSLAKFYNGKRELSQSVAGEIISHLDKSRFSDYLMDLSNDVIVLIGSALEKNDVKLIDNDIIDTCASLFVKILYDCASKDKTRKKKPSQETPIEQFSGILPKGCTISPTALAQLERESSWRKKASVSINRNL